MNRCEQFDRDQLKQLLQEALPQATEVRIADHVGSCAMCQRELETLAAERGWWNEACDRLSKSSIVLTSHRAADQNSSTSIRDGRRSSDPSGPRSFGGSAIEPGIFGSNVLFDDDAYATDFAVDFLEPSDDPSVLGRLGEYEIVEVIGRGGMGVVLKGYQKELQRFVAVKVLAPQLATSGAARRRFAREAQATAAVVNPHVMAIHSVHANSNLPYLVMPFVACESLQQRLDQSGPLDLKDILRIGMQAAHGLSAAHAQGLVHRDVKPANILLETNVDRVMLTDFGLARAVDDATLTRTGIIAGTPQYMSPEQANGDAVDHRSDLYSLGTVLYAMCTGRPPFRSETTFGVLRRIREMAPRPIREINTDIPAWFERIVLRLLEKQPDRRFSTANDVAQLLERCLAHVQQPTIVELPGECQVPPRGPRWLLDRSMRSRHLVAGALIVLTVVGLLLWSRFGQPENRVAKDMNPPDQSTSSASVSHTDDPAFDWNSTQFELMKMGVALQQIESSVVGDGSKTPESPSVPADAQ